MGKKKKFIDKKKSATFQLISRDTSNPLYTDDPSNDRVFVRVDNNSEAPFFDDVNSDGEGIYDDAPEEGGPSRSGYCLPDEVRREIVELGFPDDGYNYLSHLREIKAASEFYHNPKAKFEQLPSDVKVCVLFCFVLFCFFVVLFF